MKIPIKQEYLDEYQGILKERPMSHRKINGWWKRMNEVYSLNLYSECREWRVDFPKKLLVSKDTGIASVIIPIN